MTFRTCLFNCLVLTSIPLVALIAYFGLNYSGFCFAQMRYLSAEEKIRSVFDSHNNQITILADQEKQLYKYIKYENFHKYIKENPDCCTINPDGLYEFPPSSFLDRIFGFDSGDNIVIDFKARYLDENGQEKLEKKQFYHVVQNCGKINW